MDMFTEAAEEQILLNKQRTSEKKVKSVTGVIVESLQDINEEEQASMYPVLIDALLFALREQAGVEGVIIFDDKDEYRYKVSLKNNKAHIAKYESSDEEVSLKTTINRRLDD